MDRSRGENGKEGGKPLKITVVGDGTVGKTCMLYSYANNSFPEEYVPTIFDNLSKNLTVDGMTFSLTLWDTAGQEEYERLRPLSYPKTDCFLLCFALNNRASFANVEIKWIPELRHYCPKAAIILVGTKSDLRSELGPTSCISLSEARKLKGKIKANEYIECSAKTQENLSEVFDNAVRSVMKPGRKSGTTKCIFL